MNHCQYGIGVFRENIRKNIIKLYNLFEKYRKEIKRSVINEKK